MLITSGHSHGQYFSRSTITNGDACGYDSYLESILFKHDIDSDSCGFAWLETVLFKRNANGRSHGLSIQVKYYEPSSLFGSHHHLYHFIPTQYKR